MMHYLPTVAVSIFLLCIALDDVTGSLISPVPPWRELLLP